MKTFGTFCRIFFLVAGFLRLAESGCGNKNYTQEFGSASCTEKNNATGKFSWVFEPPANRTDLVFALKFIHYHDTFVGKVAWSSEMFLPDGTAVKNYSLIPQRVFWDDTKLWCATYVKESSPGEEACPAGGTIGGVCDETTVSITDWPPTIKGSLLQFSVLVMYEFIECVKPTAEATIVKTTNEPPKTVEPKPPTKDQPEKPAEQDEAKKETKPCPTTPKPDTNNSTPTSLKLMVVVIFLTIVIFILIGALIIVIYACRKPKPTNVGTT